MTCSDLIHTVLVQVEGLNRCTLSIEGLVSVEGLDPAVSCMERLHGRTISVIKGPSLLTKGPVLMKGMDRHALILTLTLTLFGLLSVTL